MPLPCRTTLWRAACRAGLNRDHPLAKRLLFESSVVPAAPAFGQAVYVPVTAFGQPGHATVRTILALPEGKIAAGTDYGLALFDGDAWSEFPYPRGARREARRVEALMLHRDELVVATQKSWFMWDFAERPARSKSLPRDAVGGHDDVRCLFVHDDRLLVGWRTHFEGAAGPPEVLAMTLDPRGALWCGTRFGEVHVLGGGAMRIFADSRPRPVRHLATASGALWAAAAGGLHRFDGLSWTEERGEPTALSAGPRGGLWAIRGGAIQHLGRDNRLKGLDILGEHRRPWCLSFGVECLWVGLVGGILRIPLHWSSHA